MKNRYENILKSDENIWIAVSSDETTEPFDKVIRNVVSPVILFYTLWIIDEAEKRNIKRLYFFARDGYLMHKLAEKICVKRKNGIECSYFFCSRYSFRMALYHFMDETAFEKLFIHSYRQSARYMLERAGFNREEREKVYNDISFSFDEENRIMGRTKFDEFCRDIKKSSVFREILKDRSESAYINTKKYIIQEGMQNYDTIGIVDLGWGGSLQRTLRRLLDSMNLKTKISGFYMGMLDKPPALKDSEYLTWLFDYREIYTKAWFSHNLMECICTAPHGMTEGYEVCENKIKPIFKEGEKNSFAVRRIEEITSLFLEKFKENFKFDYNERYREMALKLLKRLMFSPRKEEADALSFYNFCDDVGEQYHKNIVQIVERKDYRKELLLFKLFHRETTDGFYWYYGSVQASSLPTKAFYRYEYLFTRYLVMRKKRG